MRTVRAVIGTLAVLAVAGCALVLAGSGGSARTHARPLAWSAAGAAPARSYAVGIGEYTFTRAGRILHTEVLYPAAGAPGGAPKTSATAAPGRFPLLLWSHGLHGSPESYRPLTARLAAAGFVVAAPAYPFTNAKSDPFDADDMPNQPADAATVITEVLRLDTADGAPLAGHLDPARVGAAGHSAGGYTTAGLLSGPARDSRLRGGIIVAGGDVVAGESVPGSFSGAATPVLFVHGDQDDTVPYSSGRRLYDNCAWPKGFVTVFGGDHGAALLSSGPAGAAVGRTMVDFLRFSLYGDGAARGRLAADATAGGTAEYEATL